MRRTAAAALLGLALTTASCGDRTVGRGRLYPEPGDGTFSAFGPSRVNEPVIVGGESICSKNREVRVLSVEPTRLVGRIRFEKAGFLTGRPREVSPGNASMRRGTLPAGYQAAEGFLPPLCAAARSWLAAQVVRTGPESAGVVGMDVRYLDERGGGHSYHLPATFVLCGERNPELEDETISQCAPAARTGG